MTTCRRAEFAKYTIKPTLKHLINLRGSQSATKRFAEAVKTSISRLPKLSFLTPKSETTSAACHLRRSDTGSATTINTSTSRSSWSPDITLQPKPCEPLISGTFTPDFPQGTLHGFGVKKRHLYDFPLDDGDV